MRVVSHHLCHILLEESHSPHPYPKTLHNGGIPGTRDHGGYLRVCLPWCLHLRKCFSVVASLFWKHLCKTTSYPVGQDDRVCQTSYQRSYWRNRCSVSGKKYVVLETNYKKGICSFCVVSKGRTRISGWTL